jgi:hypothetical protein
VYLHYGFTLEFSDNGSAPVALAAAATELAHAGILGWARCDRLGADGELFCLTRQEGAIRRILSTQFGGQHAIAPLPPVADPPANLDRFHVVRRSQAPDRVTNRVHIDRIDATGWMSGWAFSSRLPEPRSFNVAISIDGEAIGAVAADRFRLDVLQSRIGHGPCGFTLRAPLEFLDGSEHLVEVTASDRDGPFATDRKTLLFPSHGTIAAPPWRLPRRTSPFEQLKREIIADGPNELSLAELRRLLEREPRLVFEDAGISDWFRRTGRRFPSYRERLVDRMATHASPLLLRFNSKSLTAEYGAARGIRVPLTYLVTTDLAALRSFDFPERFVLKPTIGSGICNFVFDRGLDLLTMKPVRVEDILAEVEKLVAKRPGTEFIVEEFIRPRGVDPPAIPPDYKTYVFGGKVRFIQPIDRNILPLRDARGCQGFFSKDWHPSPYRLRILPGEISDFAPPHTLPEMIAIAERIGEEVGDFIRVDLYDGEQGVVLGEVTTFSHEGLGFTEYGDFIFSQAWFVSPARRP